MKRELLRFTDVSVRNENQEQMHQINLMFREGECHLLWSEDGTGRMLAGLFKNGGRILHGMIHIQGREQKECSREVFRREKIFCVDVRIDLMESLSLAENMFLLRPNSMKKVWFNKKATRVRTKELLAHYGLEMDAGQNVDSLSEADKVLLSLVRLADQHAKMLVVHNLSFVCNRQKMAQLLYVLKKIKEKGTALLIYDRHPEFFLDLADDIVLVKGGTIVKKYCDRKQFEQHREKYEKTVKEERQCSAVRETESSASYCFRWTDRFGNQNNFTVFPGEILYLYAESREEQQRLYRDLLEGNRFEILLTNGTRTAVCRKVQKLMKYRIGFWGADQIEKELFPNLSIRENILMPSMQRISRYGFYRNSEKFIFSSRDLMEGLDEIESTGGFTDENTFKILCYRWKLFHPRILIIHNILSRSDQKMKEWLSGQFLEMAARGTALILLEVSEETALELADRVI